MGVSGTQASSPPSAVRAAISAWAIAAGHNPAPAQPLGPLEHRGAHAQLSEGIRRFETEQTSAGDNGVLGSVFLHVAPYGHGIRGLTQHEAAVEVDAGNLGHGALAAGGENQSVPRQSFAGAEVNLLRVAVDSFHLRVDPVRDPVLVVPLLVHEIEALHGRAAVHEARDAHAVVQRERLAPDHVDLAGRVVAADDLCRGHTGDAVADDDDAANALVE